MRAALYFPPKGASSPFGYKATIAWHCNNLLPVYGLGEQFGPLMAQGDGSEDA